VAATKEEIRRWLEEGKSEGATHVIIVFDGHDDVPYFIKPGTDVWETYKTFDSRRVMEVYDLKQPLDEQLAERRAWRMPPPKGAIDAT
jgi:hypothetical protein